jgi:hypothetical protein
MDEQGVISLARVLGDRDRGCVRQSIAGASDKILEAIVRVQRQRLIAFVEHPTPRQVFTMERNRDEPPRQRLGRRRERLLALALAQVELGGRLDGDLNHPVGQLSRGHLVEPDPVQ